MAFRRESASAAIYPSNGARNGHAIGRTLNTVQRSAVEQAKNQFFALKESVRPGD